MDFWMDLVTQTLEENDVVVYLMTKYVDDINVAISLIPRGYWWEKKGRKWKLKWFAKREEEDRERYAEQATMEKLRWLEDRMVPGLNLLKPSRVSQFRKVPNAGLPGLGPGYGKSLFNKEHLLPEGHNFPIGLPCRKCIWLEAKNYHCSGRTW